MRLFIITVLILSLCSAELSAQRDSVRIYREKAESFFDDENYKQASVYFEKLVSAEPSNPDFFFNLGYCYLQSGETVAQSVSFFDKAHQLLNEQELTPEAHTALFYQAQAYHKSYQFDQAEDIYKNLIEISVVPELVSRATEELKKIDNAKDIFFNPQPLQVMRYGILNSQYNDHSPVISADERVLMFTSRRPGNTGGLIDESGEPYEDIYIFRKGVHSEPVNIGSPVNTEYHDATCGLSIDGNQLFIYRAGRRGGGDIYHSVFDGETWSEPQKLGPNINTRYRETHASLSACEQYLYVSSNRKGGYGGFDIYVSKKQNDGTWGPAKNLGPKINTEKDEIGPYIHPDGKTLFFSSDGHPGMGGHDIFYAEKDETDQWSEPVNIGFPLNTVEHDMFFVPAVDGKGGYYSSRKDGSSNIYRAGFPAKPEKNLSVFSGFIRDVKININRYDVEDCQTNENYFTSPEGVRYPSEYSYHKEDNAYKKAYIEGAEVVFRDSTVSIPKNVSIRLIDIETKQLVDEFSATNYDGRYLIILNENKNYKLFFENEGYIYNAYNIHAKDRAGFFRIEKNVQIDNLESDYIKATRTIGFDLGQTILTDFAKTELDRLTQLLKERPELMVDVSGCDYLVYESNPDYRRLECEFAEARKKRVTSYLIKNEINPERIHINTFPVAHSGDTVAYTLFNQKQAVLEEQRKEERTATFTTVQEDANLSEEELLERYGTITIERVPFFTQNMLFNINQYETDEYSESLDNLANYLKRDSLAKIKLTGYTDLQGNPEYNRRLSQKRADYVKSELLKRGAASEQIIAQGKAFENPIALNKTEDDEYHWDALPYNRRVEIEIIQEAYNSELYIKEINIPQKYIYRAQTKSQKQYAIALEITTRQRPKESIKGVTGLNEKQYANGTYLYFFGKYPEKEQATDELEKVIDLFPNAFIFLR